MKSKIFLTIFVVAAVAVFIYAKTNQQVFAPAADFPRGAVLYLQIADLPALIKLWTESELKEKYLASANYNDFRNNHLGRKLASRWQEFSDSAGFAIDSEVLSSLTGNQASIALYDIGKLEFVFIAPVSDKIFAATKFALNRNNFTEETLTDNAIIYRANVEADRGRQTQELIFTQTKGRFILTTSEKLLVQTLNNINGKPSKNRLLDEPLFKLLSDKIEPHLATVWLNQTALNDDYYFKHYWLMSDPGKLKNLRAGIFDFEMQEGKLIERRKFLLKEAVEFAPVERSVAENMLTFLPSAIPFYRLQTGNKVTIDEAIEKTIFARRQATEKKTPDHYSGYPSFDDYSFDDYNDYSGDNYESLGDRFDETIDDSGDDDQIERRESEIDFSNALQAANPRAVLTFTLPKTLPAPMFVGFERAAVFHLASPTSFDQEGFEAAIREKLSAQVLIAASGVKLNWETKSENSDKWRELKLPMLGWNVYYVLVGNELIVTNDVEFLQQILTARLSPRSKLKNLKFSSLTVIDFSQKENAYDNVFNELKKQHADVDFFTNNIKSLFYSISRLNRIEIIESHSQNIFDEELIFSF